MLNYLKSSCKLLKENATLLVFCRLSYCSAENVEVSLGLKIKIKKITEAMYFGPDLMVALD
jgi:hypothetical protein